MWSLKLLEWWMMSYFIFASANGLSRRDLNLGNIIEFVSDHTCSPIVFGCVLHPLTWFSRLHSTVCTFIKETCYVHRLLIFFLPQILEILLYHFLFVLIVNFIIFFIWYSLEWLLLSVCFNPPLNFLIVATLQDTLLPISNFNLLIKFFFPLLNFSPLFKTFRKGILRKLVLMNTILFCITFIASTLSKIQYFCLQ